MTHVAFQQGRELVLDNFRLAQQPLLDSEPLQPRLWGAHPVRLGVAICAHSLDEVIRIVPDVSTLGLSYCTVSVP